MGEVYGAWLATPTGWRAFTAYATSPPTTTRTSHTHRPGRLPPWRRGRTYRQARVDQQAFSVAVVLTLGTILIPWLLYRIVWSLVARRPKTITHTHIISPDTFEWPLAPGDVWLGHGLAESGHWVVLAPEYREPEWITSRERDEHQARQEASVRSVAAHQREKQLRETRRRLFDQ